VHDVNGDGNINDATELFGEETALKDGSKAVNGFAALSELDSNHDGVFNSQDQDYRHIQVWRDTNSDGISQLTELMSLATAGVSDIHLDAKQISQLNQGNVAGLRSSWIDDQGNANIIDDIWFNYESGGEASQQIPSAPTDKTYYSGFNSQSNSGAAVLSATEIAAICSNLTQVDDHMDNLIFADQKDNQLLFLSETSGTELPETDVDSDLIKECSPDKLSVMHSINGVSPYSNNDILQELIGDLGTSADL
jgi:hypothetical protein